MTKIKFYPKSHKYKLGRTTLDSVTTVIGHYFEHFDATKIAKKKAYLDKQNGIKGTSIMYYKKLWKESAQHGTDVHALIEQYINTGNLPFEASLYETKTKRKVMQLMKYVDRIKHKKLTPEVIVYDKNYLIAGTIDLIVTNTGKVTLIDWKTNKVIYKNSFGNKKAKYPIQDMDDCNYNKYTLQLSVYAWILEKCGYKIDKLLLVHVMEDSVQEYQLNYEYEKVEAILNDRNNKKRNGKVSETTK